MLLQVQEMEDGLGRLDRRCKQIIKGSCSYRDTVQGLSGNQMAFAECLDEFCGGTDEDSMLLGMACCFHPLQCAFFAVDTQNIPTSI